jgi:hypothetical protein
MISTSLVAALRGQVTPSSLHGEEAAVFAMNVLTTYSTELKLAFLHQHRDGICKKVRSSCPFYCPSICPSSCSSVHAYLSACIQVFNYQTVRAYP